MAQHEAERPLPEPVRSALVDAQDHEMTVSESRKLVAERFGVTARRLRQIEQEGLDND